MATFSLSSALKSFIDPFKNLLKPQNYVSKPATSASISPPPTPATWHAPMAPMPNMSTNQGSTYSGFSTPTMPQVKAPTTLTVPKNYLSTSTAPVATKPAVTPTTPTTPTISPSTAYSAPVISPVTPPQSPQTTQEAPTPPPTPTISPETQKAIDTANLAYQEALRISPDELSTQGDLDKLIESAKTAYLNAEGQAIPLEFITGQIGAIEKRAMTLSEPLERKLARMQAARQSSLESSKFALDRADKKASTELGIAKDLRTESESARRFGITQGNTEASQEFENKKFEEDKRQFGLNYALEQQKARATQTKDAAEKATAETAKTNASLDTINNINQLLQGDYQGITGGILGRSVLTRLGTTNQKEDALFKNIQAQLALGARQLIKGSGAISDFEAKTLQSAASLFGSGENSTLSNKDFKNAMIQIKGALSSNAGLPVVVRLTNPSTGEVLGAVQTNREGIGKAISDGLIVEYE